MQTHGGVVLRKRERSEAQLSLFEQNEPTPTVAPEPTEPTTFFDYAKKRFEENPNMKPEEYKRWIKYLIHVSLKSID